MSKQLIQNFKTGRLQIVDIPVPAVGDKDVLVRTVNSVISLGTERILTSFARKSLVSKAKARPDLLKQFIEKARREGFTTTLKQAMRRLDEPLPLGYSSVGKIVENGELVTRFRKNDRVALFGTGEAPHAEYTSVPADTAVKVPENVSNESAAFTGIGAICVNAIKNAGIKPGDKVAVIGLGMIGFLTALISEAMECDVAVFDVDKHKLEQAKKLAIPNVYDCNQPEIGETALAGTNHKGFDKVIIAASTDSNQPILLAAKISGFRGRIVLVGVVGLNIPRRPFYENELEFVVSKDAGSPDKTYCKEKAPTQKSNMQDFLNLISDGRLNPEKLITRKINFDDISDSYEQVLDTGAKQKEIGVLIQYGPDHGGSNPVTLYNTKQPETKAETSNQQITVGIIGAGQFTRNILMPILAANKRLKLRAIASQKGISAQQAAEKWAIEYFATDYQKIIEDETIQAVFITTRHNLHAQMILEALRRKKNVFVEKPLCINEKQLQTIVGTYKACKEPPVLMVGFNRRFAPLTTRASKILKKIGNAPKLITIRSNAGYIPKDHWTQSPQIGGGRIIGEACHYVDLLQYFIGANPVSVYTSSRNNSVDMDNMLVNMKYPDGSIASICYCADGSRSHSKERVEIFCNQMLCVVDDFKSIDWAVGSKRKRKNKFVRDMGYENEIRVFIDAVTAETPLPVTFEDYCSTTLVTFKIMESARRNQKVIINYNDFC